jgi:hypothetical protein
VAVWRRARARVPRAPIACCFPTMHTRQWGDCACLGDGARPRRTVVGHVRQRRCCCRLFRGLGHGTNLSHHRPQLLPARRTHLGREAGGALCTPAHVCERASAGCVSRGRMRVHRAHAWGACMGRMHGALHRRLCVACALQIGPAVGVCVRGNPRAAQGRQAIVCVGGQRGRMGREWHATCTCMCFCCSSTPGGRHPSTHVWWQLELLSAAQGSYLAVLWYLVAVCHNRAYRWLRRSIQKGEKKKN